MKASRFHVGQQVIAVKADRPEMLGRVGTIIGPLQRRRCPRTGKYYDGYPVDFGDQCLGAPPHAIRPYDPPPLGSWRALAGIWQPKPARC